MLYLTGVLLNLVNGSLGENIIKLKLHNNLMFTNKKLQLKNQQILQFSQKKWKSTKWQRYIEQIQQIYKQKGNQGSAKRYSRIYNDLKKWYDQKVNVLGQKIYQNGLREYHTKQKLQLQSFRRKIAREYGQYDPQMIKDMHTNTEVFVQQTIIERKLEQIKSEIQQMPQKQRIILQSSLKSVNQQHKQNVKRLMQQINISNEIGASNVAIKYQNMVILQEISSTKEKLKQAEDELYAVRKQLQIKQSPQLTQLKKYNNDLIAQNERNLSQIQRKQDQIKLIMAEKQKLQQQIKGYQQNIQLFTLQKAKLQQQISLIRIKEQDLALKNKGLIQKNILDYQNLLQLRRQLQVVKRQKQQSATEFQSKLKKIEQEMENQKIYFKGKIDMSNAVSQEKQKVNQFEKASLKDKLISLQQKLISEKQINNNLLNLNKQLSVKLNKMQPVEKSKQVISQAVSNQIQNSKPVQQNIDLKGVQPIVSNNSQQKNQISKPQQEQLSKIAQKHVAQIMQHVQYINQLKINHKEIQGYITDLQKTPLVVLSNQNYSMYNQLMQLSNRIDHYASILDAKLNGQGEKTDRLFQLISEIGQNARTIQDDYDKNRIKQFNQPVMQQITRENFDSGEQYNGNIEGKNEEKGDGSSIYGDIKRWQQQNKVQNKKRTRSEAGDMEPNIQKQNNQIQTPFKRIKTNNYLTIKKNAYQLQNLRNIFDED